jgi:hypothetical protein
MRGHSYKMNAANGYVLPAEKLQQREKAFAVRRRAQLEPIVETALPR